ncbi:MAG: AMP-binding protein [Acidimicrobiales bacterium]|jgi:1-acyl-sn-glycerol-3-phosphate acyltransferase
MSASRVGAGGPQDVDLLLDEVAMVAAEVHGGNPPPVTLTSDLGVDLGLDSLSVVELYDRLQAAFGVTLPEEVLATATTPGDWLAAILEAGGRPIRYADRPAVTPLPLRTRGGDWPVAAETLLDALAWHVEQHRERSSIRILQTHGGLAYEDLTYGDLNAESRSAACGLVAAGLYRGDRVVLMLPTGREYFVAFLAALLAGGVPVPIYPAVAPSQLAEHLARQVHLVEDCEPSILVTTADAVAPTRAAYAGVASLHSVHSVDTLLGASDGSRRLPAVSPDDPALIQYTSGSTGEPRGVVLTHAQLLANVRSLGRAADVTSEDVFVSWLPLYHDMGLVGAWHCTLYFGLPLILLSPLQFLARPVSWFEAISTYRGTLSAAPNFAFQTCVERIADADMDGLDLSSWRIAIDGSEPVSEPVVDAFVERFAPFGLLRGAICPAYGLAEVGVGLTITPVGRGPWVDHVARDRLEREGRAVPAPPDDPATRAVVSCGAVVPGFEVRVVDDRGHELPDRREGQVECRGPSATAGYFGNPEATAALWHNGWMRTGDLGYIGDGELFVTGRVKDLIIRGGRNLHPEDLEEVLAGLEGLSRAGVAVFGSTDPRRGTERLIVVAETDLEPVAARDELTDRITRSARETLGVPAEEVVLVPTGSILRTASLKIRRSATRDAFEAGAYGNVPRPFHGIRRGRTRPDRRFDARGRSEAVVSWLYAGYLWALVVLFGLPLWCAVVLLPLTERARWSLARGVSRSLRELAGIGLEVHGEPPVPGEPAVVASNHASFVDALVIVLALGGQPVFVTSSDMAAVRPVGTFLRRMGCLFVHRDQTDHSTDDVETMANLVRSGRTLVVFPEGSIVRAPGVRPFHLGAFAAAAGAGCPVVPAGIRGSRDVVRPGSYRPRRAATVEVSYGRPLVAVSDDFAGAADLARRSREAVAGLCGEPEVV